MIRTCSRTKESFVEELVDESGSYMVAMAKAMDDSPRFFALEFA